MKHISPHYTSHHVSPLHITPHPTTTQAKSVLGNKGDMLAVDGQLTELARQITGYILTLHLHPSIWSTRFISLLFLSVPRSALPHPFFLFFFSSSTCTSFSHSTLLFSLLSLVFLSTTQSLFPSPSPFLLCSCCQQGTREQPTYPS